MARQPLSKLRPRQSFRRRQGQRQPRSITLIVCEGETEEAYFQGIRRQFGLTNSEVVVADNTRGSAPISVVEYAVRRAKEPGGYDYVYCVFDRDDHKSFAYARDRIAKLRAQAKPFHEAVSIPCFELWVLLHFERTDAPFEVCAQVVNRIRAQHLAGYSKAHAAIVAQLIARIDHALEHARWLEGRQVDNPMTSVHRLIDHLHDVCESRV